MPAQKAPRAAAVIAAASKLRQDISRLQFSPPVAHIYNPLDYAWPVHQRFIKTFVTGPDFGTAAEVTPVREVDDRVIGDGTVGEVTQMLQERYFDVVRGTDDSHPEWLTRL